MGWGGSWMVGQGVQPAPPGAPARNERPPEAHAYEEGAFRAASTDRLLHQPHLISYTRAHNTFPPHPRCGDLVSPGGGETEAQEVAGPRPQLVRG